MIADSYALGALRRTPIVGRSELGRIGPSLARAEEARRPDSTHRPDMPTGSDDTLLVVDQEPEKFLFGAWKNVILLAWAAQADDTVIGRLKVRLARIARSRPGPRSCVSVIAAGLPMPTDEARAGILELMNANGAQVGCLAVVIKGAGFQRSALQSAHTGMHLASTKTFEMAVLDGVEDLADWLLPRHLKTGVVLDAKRLVAIANQASDGAACARTLEYPMPTP